MSVPVPGGLPEVPEDIVSLNKALAEQEAFLGRIQAVIQEKAEKNQSIRAELERLNGLEQEKLVALGEAEVNGASTKKIREELDSARGRFMYLSKESENLAAEQQAVKEQFTSSVDKLEEDKKERERLTRLWIQELWEAKKDALFKAAHNANFTLLAWMEGVAGQAARINDSRWTMLYLVPQHGMPVCQQNAAQLREELRSFVFSAGMTVETEAVTEEVA